MDPAIGGRGTVFGENLDFGTASHLASYRWGGLFCHFEMAPARANSLAHLLVADLVGNWPAETDDDMARAHVSLIHEITHLLQDVATGAGNWDYLVKAHYTTELLSNLRVLTWSWEVPAPYRRGQFQGTSMEETYDAVEKSLDEVREQMICLRSTALPKSRLELLRATMRDLNAGQAEDPLELDSAALGLQVESILENEAMAAVLSVLLSKGYDDQSSESMNDSSALWMPTNMPDLYTRLFYAVSSIWDLGELNWGVYFAAVARHLGILCDLALAHPSPRWLAEHGESREDYEPGVRFIRMLRSLASFDQPESDRFEQAFAAGDTLEVERLLLANCPYPYPVVGGIYADWADVLGDVEDDPEADLRRDVAIGRSGTGPWPVKSFTQAFASRVPIHLYSSFGYQRMSYQLSGLPEEIPALSSETVSTENELTDLEAQLAVKAMDSATVEFLGETGMFRCPLATRGLCSARVEACSAGYTALYDLPASSGCHARSRLSLMSFNTLWNKDGRHPAYAND